jgi:hypothetical protein
VPQTSTTIAGETSTTSSSTTSTTIEGTTTTSIGDLGSTSTTIANETTTTLGRLGTTSTTAGGSHNLPFTGGGSGLVPFALLCLAAGAGLVLSARRRKARGTA